jgi:hypothetical protein
VLARTCIKSSTSTRSHLVSSCGLDTVSLFCPECACEILGLIRNEVIKGGRCELTERPREWIGHINLVAQTDVRSKYDERGVNLEVHAIYQEEADRGILHITRSQQVDLTYMRASSSLRMAFRGRQPKSKFMRIVMPVNRRGTRA